MTSLSVVIPTRNRAGLVVEALDSIVAQTEQPLEVIVIDNDSSDDTADRIRRHPLSSRIRYRREGHNLGAGVARNVAVEMARGEIVVFLDSDDVLEPAHHARVLQVVDRRPEIALFCCDSSLIDTNGLWLYGQRTYNQIHCSITGHQIQSGVRSLEEVFLFSTPFAGCAVRRAAYLDLGGLEQDLFPLEDYDLQLRMAGAGHCLHYEHAPLARYRMHATNSSGMDKAVFVQEQRLRCLQLAVERYPSLRSLGPRVDHRLGEVRRDLALALIKAGYNARGVRTLARALAEDPSGFRSLLTIGKRKLKAAWSGRPV